MKWKLLEYYSMDGIWRVSEWVVDAFKTFPNYLLCLYIATSGILLLKCICFCFVDRIYRIVCILHGTTWACVCRSTKMMMATMTSKSWLGKRKIERSKERESERWRESQSDMQAWLMKLGNENGQTIRFSSIHAGLCFQGKSKTIRYNVKSNYFVIEYLVDLKQIWWIDDDDSIFIRILILFLVLSLSFSLYRIKRREKERERVLFFWSENIPALNFSRAIS